MNKLILIFVILTTSCKQYNCPGGYEFERSLTEDEMSLIPYSSGDTIKFRDDNGSLEILYGEERKTYYNTAYDSRGILDCEELGQLILEEQEIKFQGSQQLQTIVVRVNLNFNEDNPANSLEDQIQANIHIEINDVYFPWVNYGRPHDTITIMDSVFTNVYSYEGINTLHYSPEAGIIQFSISEGETWYADFD